MGCRPTETYAWLHGPVASQHLPQTQPMCTTTQIVAMFENESLFLFLTQWVQKYEIILRPVYVERTSGLDFLFFRVNFYGKRRFNFSFSLKS